jgi:hypothetical protein
MFSSICQTQQPHFQHPEQRINDLIIIRSRGSRSSMTMTTQSLHLTLLPDEIYTEKNSYKTPQK